MTEPQTYPTDDGGAVTGHVPSRYADANGDGHPDERPTAVDATQRSVRTLAQGALAAAALAVLVVLTQTIGAAQSWEDINWATLGLLALQALLTALLSWASRYIAPPK